MTTSSGAGPARLAAIDAATMRRLLLHEARVHAIPDRELRDLEDAILLHDPVEAEPFWNRLEGLRWPIEPRDFDRRLTEALILFQAIGRQPHIWTSPLYDSPVDLIARLEANGFRDMGSGNIMVLVDRSAIQAARVAPLPPGVTVERLADLGGPTADAAARAIVEVLVDAFEVGEERRSGIEAETVASLGHGSFHHYLVRLDGVPAAVARRATFDGVSYLSSIGAAGWARGRGFGRLVTALASVDAQEAQSEWTYLGVFADNTRAIRSYERTGFARVGESCPDLLLLS